MKHLSLIILFLSINFIFAQEYTKDINVVYGDHHIYTIETPSNWINDKKHDIDIFATKITYQTFNKFVPPQLYGRAIMLFSPKYENAMMTCTPTHGSIVMLCLPEV